MGINAGVLCLRHPNTEGDDLPWPSTLLLFFPSPKLSTMKGRGTACLSTADGKSLKVFLLTAVVATAHELAKAYRPQLLQHVATDTWLTGKQGGTRRRRRRTSAPRIQG